MIGIYCIENIITGKKYIGASNNIKSRWSSHRSSLRRNIHRNRYLQEDWNTYGEDSFKHYVLEECSEDNLDEREKYWISFYQNDKLYNQTGGGGSRKNSTVNGFSDDMKQRMSEKRSGISSTRTEAVIEGYKVVSQKLTGRTLSPETRKKLSDINKGKTYSEEYKRKMSESCKGHIVTEETRRKISIANTGRRVSEETRRKLSERPITDECRKRQSEAAIKNRGVAVKCLEDNLIFRSIGECADHYNIHTRTSIKRAMDSGRELKGLHFSYVC